MKVVILNFPGTVGKTTLSVHMFSPNMGNAPIYAVETINETADGLGVDVERIRGERFKDLFKALMTIDDAIVDVGTSNVEAFLEGMLRYEGSHLEFDFFVVPLTSGAKEQKETISMVNTLSEFGIEADKIRILFNKVHKDVEEEFAPFLAYAKRERKCRVNTRASIQENELFDMLQLRRMSIADALNDEKDYKALARAVPADGDPKLRANYTAMHLIKSLSRGVNQNLTSAFTALIS